MAPWASCFFEKYLGKVPFFFSFVWQLYFNDFIFEIWIENILQKNIITLVLFQKIAKEHLNFQYSFRFFFLVISLSNTMHNNRINMWYLCIVLREITQNKTDRNIANFIGLLLFFFKRTRARCLFLFFRLTIVFQGFYIWNLNRNILQKNIIAKKAFLSLWDYGKRSMFYHFRKLENLKIFIGNISILISIYVRRTTSRSNQIDSWIMHCNVK